MNITIVNEKNPAARQFFEHFEEIQSQKDADYERDLEIEMATTF